ncbi:MAG: exonuclease domain-containing protein, partial [Oscillospiraceae bacterium]
MNNSIFNYFNYIENISIKDEFKNSEIIKIENNKKEKQLFITAVFSVLIKYEDIKKVEKYLQSHFKYNIKINAKYEKGLFNVSYIDEILLFLKEEKAIINGFFNNADYTYSEKDNVIDITLKHGGLQILNKINFTDLFKSMVFKLFVENINVNLQSVFDDENYTVNEIKCEKDDNILNQASYVEDDRLLKNDDKGIKNKTINKETKSLINKKEGKIIYGSKIKGNFTDISDIKIDIGSVTVWGDVFASNKINTRDKRNCILTYYITDYTSSATLKMFCNLDEAKFTDNIKKGDRISVKGDYVYDKYENENIIRIKSINKLPKDLKTDDESTKRVELHLHTNMSSMDGISKPKDLVDFAYRLGHKAVAITDHGVLQAYPDIMNTADDIKRNDPESNFKVIYGLEGYMVDDTQKIVIGSNDKSIDDEIVIFDIETTGLSNKTEKITEIGAVKIRDGKIIDSFTKFVNPEKPISAFITKLTGITDNMVKDADLEDKAVAEFLFFCKDSLLVAHNANFDIGFIKAACRRHDIAFNNSYLDTVILSQNIFKNLKNYKLNTLQKHLNLPSFNHHRAYDDAKMLSDIFFKIIEELKKL